MAVSEIVEDTRDALLKYLVSSEKAHEAVASLKSGCFDRQPNNRRRMTRGAD